MYCSRCGKKISEGAQFCSGCGTSVVAEDTVTEKRPVAGIAVGAVLGVIGIAWALTAIFKSFSGNAAGIEAALYKAFPASQDIGFFGSTLGLVSNSALLIGVLMAFLRHANGHKTVRITAYCASFALLLIFIALYVAITGAPAWQTLDASTKGSLIGGLIGGAIGGLLQWGLILFLFRKSRWL